MGFGESEWAVGLQIPQRLKLSVVFESWGVGGFWRSHRERAQAHDSVPLEIRALDS